VGGKLSGSPTAHEGDMGGGRLSKGDPFKDFSQKKSHRVTLRKGKAEDAVLSIGRKRGTNLDGFSYQKKAGDQGRHKKS